MDDNLFDSLGKWLRGNLHCHTTESDGRLAPQEVVDYYSNCGYDFLALTDHEVVTRVESRKLTLIPGTEIVAGHAVLGDSHHVVALNVEDNDALQRHKLESLDSLLDYVASVKGLAFIAHPYWSRLTTRDLSEVGNSLGIEVYNTGCDVLVAKGFSMVHWDNLLSQGKRPYGFAVDDAHWYPIDSAGGWIWVKVREESTEGILAPIREGRFYSTMGPSIDRFTFSNGTVEARFSPVRRVDLISMGGSGFSASTDSYEKVKETKNDMIRVSTDKNAEGVEKARIELGNRIAHLELRNKSIIHLRLEGVTFQKYLRLEITDFDGKKAWSNSVSL